ncbi:glycoside hydrolase family 127 protein [Proteiniphilum sp.]|uniref:glycoside hydrolase family 127 protein n=1 Tax=Proteiniphilum sp. TaxID=1926877 RepID=UPI002B1FBD6C|nr:beta-L-arabinofuranosidase domain-containing protein [Proteiniphilum sp.]MEA4917812.1 glycoside hydrolase family 127 protein [Proteiniphilum sp.]
MNKIVQYLLFLFAYTVSVISVDGQNSAGTNRLKVNDKLAPAPYGSLHIGGYVGEKMDLCINNRVMAHDIERLVAPFQLRNDEHWGFRCEFWGKWFTSAMLGYGYSPTCEHHDVIEKAMKELIRTQSQDGYIGTYPVEHHLKDWDIWGRKYVLLGLIAYYDQIKDESILHVAEQVADHLIMEAGPESGVNLAETGWIGWKGLASSSVLEPIALLYQRTGKQKYLDFGEYIIRLWDSPNKLTPTGIRLVREALNQTPLWKMSGAPKAYEMMSCFEGLCEMYRITGNRNYLNASRLLVESVIRDEIMLVGSGSIAEIWCNGKMRQHDPMYQGLETCVTVTWMKFLYQMLRLSGDSKYADQLEISLYNALMASQTPKGEWWSYYTGLMGERVPSHQQFGDVGMSCCVANGPRGMLLTPSWAVMSSSVGIAINLYAPMKAELQTPRQQSFMLDMTTAYPLDGETVITVIIPKKEKFSIDLRIPAWSKKTVIKVNGEIFDKKVLSGSYAVIEREWSDKDRIEISFDMKSYVVDAPSGVPDAAIQRGPIVLAFDSRLVPFRHGVEAPPMYRYSFMKNEDNSIDVSLVSTPPVKEIWMTFQVPLLDEAGERHELPMCDYASAGNSWKEGNLFRVWIPQPFDFRHLYINNLGWSINVTDNSPRPTIPEFKKK